MSYKINPKTEEELNLFGLLPDGTYDFEVYKSEKNVSASGNDMAKLYLKVWTPDGSVKILNDFLVFSDSNYCIRKIRHFCETTGILQEFEAGEIRDDFSGLNGRVHLVTKKGTLIPTDKLNGKPHGSLYPDKMEVKDYVTDKKEMGMKPLPEVLRDEFNDDIPF